MSTPMKEVKVDAVTQGFADDIFVVLNKHAGALPADVMLALSAYVTGQIMALQDQRKMTTGMAFEIIERNLQEGNRSIVEGMRDIKPGGNA